jgi:hypothetical protein
MMNSENCSFSLTKERTGNDFAYLVPKCEDPGLERQANGPNGGIGRASTACRMPRFPTALTRSQGMRDPVVTTSQIERFSNCGGEFDLECLITCDPAGHFETIYKVECRIDIPYRRLNMQTFPVCTMINRYFGKPYWYATSQVGIIVNDPTDCN